MNKDDKVKTELELKEIEEDNIAEDNKSIHNKKINNNSAGKNPMKSPAVKQKVKFKSESSKGVVDLSYTAKKPREFNISTSVKKNGGVASTNSNGKIKKKK